MFYLTDEKDEAYDARQPLPVDDMGAQLTTLVSETITYNGKAAAGAISVNALPYRNIFNPLGDRIGSYWGNKENLVYASHEADSGIPIKDRSFVSLTETAGAAACVITDTKNDLELMFESLTTTVKRYVLKATDTSGKILYGWIFGVAKAGNVFTFDIVNNRLTQTRNWVGSTAAFTHTSLKSVEIFAYQNSLSFGTGTTFTEEVAFPQEYTKSWRRTIELANTLSNGNYFVDYLRGLVIGKRADTTASETVTYNVEVSATATPSVITPDVNLKQVGGTATVTGGINGLLAVGGNIASGATDTGNPVKVGGKYNLTPPTLTNGQRGDLQLNPEGELKVADGILTEVKSDNSLGISGAKQSLQSHFEDATGWVESTGADNLATTTEHRGAGINSLEFDKIAGDATAMISKVVTAFDMNEYSDHSIGLNHIYLSDLTDVEKAFVRIGTDSTNYWQYDFQDTLLTAGWNQLQENISMPTSQTGAGAVLGAITYIAFGIQFDAAADTLADIRTGGWAIKRVLETTAVVTSDVQVDVPFVALRDWNSYTRLDVASGANYNYLYNRNTDGTNLMPTGDVDARAIVTALTAAQIATLTPPAAITGFATETTLASVKTAVEAIDNAISGTEMQVDVVAALPAGTNNIGDVDVLTTSLDKSINGAGAPTIDSYNHVAINLTTGADQLLVSSAANKQIWVYGYGFTMGDADGQSVSLQDEDDTAITGIMEFARYGGISVSPSGNFTMPVFKLATDKDLEVDITGGDVDGWLAYAIISV